MNVPTPISQSERAARIRAEAAQEAQEREDRLKGVMMLSSTFHGGEPATGRKRHHDPQVIEERVIRLSEGRARLIEDAHNAPQREPCVACGVRADRHVEFGCKRWRLMR